MEPRGRHSLCRLNSESCKLEKCVIPTFDPPIGLRKTNLKQQVYYPLESLRYFSFSILIKGVFMLEMETLGGGEFSLKNCQSQSAAHFCQCCLSINSMRHPTKLGKWGIETPSARWELIIFSWLSCIQQLVFEDSIHCNCSNHPKYWPFWSRKILASHQVETSEGLENPSGAYYPLE